MLKRPGLQEMVKLGVFVFLFHLLSASLIAVYGGDGGGVEMFAAATGCGSTLSECLIGEEYQMESEMSRRVLATSQYISYAALQRNTIPCNRRGASYYNCSPARNSNPYSRGCSVITRCRK